HLTGRMAASSALPVRCHGRRMCECRELQGVRGWRYLPGPAAGEVRVGVLGRGVLGSAALAALKPFGYRLRAWTRTPKAVADVECFAGAEALAAFLAETDMLAVLLPLTAATQGLVNRGLLRQLSRAGRSPLLPGPVLINAGRGGLQVDADILAALEAGELYAASLD